MPEEKPSFALQDKTGQALLWETDRVRLQAVNNIRKLRLQAHPKARVNPAPLEELVGTVLPAGPQETVNSNPSAYWLAPNDWLLLDSAADMDETEVALRASSAGALHVVTDQTDAYGIIDIAGDAAVTRLAEGCSVDLDASVFPSGRYALTRLQHFPVIIHRLDDTPRFRLLADRSLARCLWDWLAV